MTMPMGIRATPMLANAPAALPMPRPNISSAMASISLPFSLQASQVKKSDSAWLSSTIATDAPQKKIRKMVPALLIKP